MIVYFIGDIMYKEKLDSDYEKILELINKKVNIQLKLKGINEDIVKIENGFSLGIISNFTSSRKNYVKKYAELVLSKNQLESLLKDIDCDLNLLSLSILKEKEKKLVK